ncbi:extracellular solute-binding protein [Evansella halocellulosilytica]|uniref:extracellular solute-binding protein n=1 Tax=Evansella halocellulosilytica TaxID=2011013 RepID=UPI000BB97757|nr:extracellular solute-binding protein [Evansella halocellulosilytica]
MKIMRSSLFLLIAILFVLTGCGDNGESGGSADDEVELHWSTVSNRSPQAALEDAAIFVTNKLDAFEEENPHVNIKMDILSGDISEAMTRLLEQANQGRAPDVSIIDSYIFPRYIDYLQPLDDYMEEAGIDIEDFFPFAQDIVTGPDGKVYGLYTSTDSRVLFYNTELVPEPPKTWDEVFEIGAELTEQGYEGFLYPGGRGEGAMVTTLWPLFWAQGGELVDDDGTPVFGDSENREKMLNVLNFIQDTVESGITPQRVASYGSESDLNEELSTGNVAMFMGGNWQDATMRDVLSEEEFEKWDVAHLPQLNEGHEVTSAGGWVWGIFAEEEEKQRAAFELVTDLFISEQGMGEYNSISGHLPARLSVYDSEHYEGSVFNDSYVQFLEENARIRPSSTYYPEISNQMQIAISEVVAGSKTPEQALDDAWEVVNNQ